MGLVPGQRTKIPHAMLHSQMVKKQLKNNNKLKRRIFKEKFKNNKKGQGTAHAPELNIPYEEGKTPKTRLRTDSWKHPYPHPI